jgi:hypothetical protein
MTASGNVILDPTGHFTWTAEIQSSGTIILTKWFHIKPSTWTNTLLLEELWILAPI